MKKIKDALLERRAKSNNFLDFNEVKSVREQLKSSSEYIKVKASEYVANNEAVADEIEFLIKFCEDNYENK